MLIRPATIEDIAGIASLVERYWEFESMEGFDRPRIETLLGALLAEPDRGACWVAETEGRLCGYLLAVFMFSLEHGGSMAEIDELFVSPGDALVGRGRAAVGAAPKASWRQRGLVRLQLQLGVANERARILFRAQGFAGAPVTNCSTRPLDWS